MVLVFREFLVFQGFLVFLGLLLPLKNIWLGKFPRNIRQSEKLRLPLAKLIPPPW
jgi:hypothetical protein